MKLKTRLKLSFFLIALMPVVCFSLCLGMLLSIMSSNINAQYGIEGTNWESIYNPIDILTKIGDRLYEDLQDKLEEDPDILSNQDYLMKIVENLEEKGTDVVIRKNGHFIFISAGLEVKELKSLLPDYGEISNVSESGVYYGGDRKCIIRQIDINGENGDEYSISIISYMEKIVPDVENFWVEIILAIVLILLLISGIMIYWIYKATIIPLNRLKEGTRNISEGNLDFVVETSGEDEISELCRDFEFMRQKLKENAEEKLKSDKESKELISNISHDLKTPITAIKGYVEGLRDGVAVTEEKRDKYLQTIYKKAIEMDKLIDELTLYSKIDANRIPYSFNKLYVGEFFGDCNSSLSLELEAKDVQFGYYNSVGEDVQIIADAEQLSRVINNIVSNSTKYHADRRIKIDLRVKDEGDFIKVEIEDNGKGISKSALPHIFERTYRGDLSRNSATGGSGIGLAIVKKIIEDHGGRIWAESKEGEGTTMCFVLRKYFGGKDEQNIDN